MISQEVGRLVAFCSLECHWQSVGPLKVSYMINAYFQLNNWAALSAERIMTLGHEVEPQLNPDTRWRQVRVSVGTSIKPDWQEVPRLMDQLLAAEPPAIEWFKEFEEIHPFRDGNGRVGALLYNWINNTYEPLDLKLSPNLWSDPNRTKDYPYEEVFAER